MISKKSPDGVQCGSLVIPKYKTIDEPIYVIRIIFLILVTSEKKRSYLFFRHHFFLFDKRVFCMVI